jgi:2-dehydropantoate 2-reductase
VVVVAREGTAAAIARDGLRVRSVRLGAFTARPRAVAVLREPADALLVATKATALAAAAERVEAEPGLVVPLLNGIEHVAWLRERFARVAAGAIRVEATRTAPGVVEQTSPFLRVDVAPRSPATGAVVHALRRAEVPADAHDDEAAVLWGKLVRLAAIALTTTAYAEPLGAVRAHPRHRLALEGVVEEAARVAAAEGAPVAAERVIAELADAHPGLLSSMARDVAAGREPELDAIAGALARAAARHGIAVPVTAELTERVRSRR